MWGEELTDEELLEACEAFDGNGNADGESTASPLEKWRKGYLWVSNLVSQTWCEQQMEYGFSRPQEAKDPDHVVKGSELHLARELATEDYVDVKIESNEDIFAVKALNLFQHLTRLSSGQDASVCREVPVFGQLGSLTLLGKVDEIKVVNENGDLAIVEFKTRVRRSLPSKSQELGHKLQVMIYKHLLDNLDSLDIAKLSRVLKLDMDKTLGKDVQKHAGGEIKSLTDLFQCLSRAVKRLDRKVTKLQIEYCAQDNKEVFATSDVEYDEYWLLTTVDKLEQYWSGNRSAQGVDIEEAWKCSMCSFAENCDWRIAKSKELQKRNNSKQ